MSEWNGNSNPALDARIEGVPVFTATPGDSVHEHVFTFDCDFSGIEIYSECAELGHTVTLETQYNAGPYGWKRYKKFGKTFNLFKNDKCRIVLFPTKPKAGIKLVIKYNNPTQTDVKFAINLFQFADMELVNPSILQEGEDW